MSASFLEDNVVLGLSVEAGRAGGRLSRSGGEHILIRLAPANLWGRTMRCVCGWGATFALRIGAAAPQSCRSPHLTPLPSKISQSLALAMQFPIPLLICAPILLGFE
jgi:hypothetical protein